MSHIIEQLPRGYVPSKHIIRIEIYLQSHNFNNSYFRSDTNYNSTKRNIRKRSLKMRYVSLEGSVVIYDYVVGDAFYLLEFSKSYEISNPFLPPDSHYIFG